MVSPASPRCLYTVRRSSACSRTALASFTGRPSLAPAGVLPRNSSNPPPAPDRSTPAHPPYSRRSYEKLKKMLADKDGNLSVPARLAAGAGAACISTTVRRRLRASRRSE